MKNQQNLNIGIKSKNQVKSKNQQNQVKEPTKFEHRNDVASCSKCLENDCDDFYIGETDRRMSERIIHHNKRDKNSHPLQHAQNKKHAHVG